MSSTSKWKSDGHNFLVIVGVCDPVLVVDLEDWEGAELCAEQSDMKSNGGSKRKKVEGLVFRLCWMMVMKMELKEQK